MNRPLPRDPGTASLSLPEIEDLLQGWVLDGRSQGFSTATIANRRIVVRGLTRWLRQAGHNACCQDACHPYQSFALWCLPPEGLWPLPKEAFGW